MSKGGGVLIDPTAQNLHPRVHSWPAIMKVASPLDQQSWIFGHLASSHTVCSLLSLTADFVSLYIFCCSPLGRLVLNHEGSLSRVLILGLFLAMGSCLPLIFSPPQYIPCVAYQKDVLEAIFSSYSK